MQAATPRPIRTARAGARRTQFPRAFPDGPVIHRAYLETLAASRRLYVIFIVPRSGSTWLTELAERASLGRPDEWFNEGLIHGDDPTLGPRSAFVDTDIHRYISKVMSTSASPSAMGVEISHLQARLVMDVLEAPLPRGVTFFYLRRRNLLAQAISLYRSVTSGVFAVREGAEQTRNDIEAVPYDPDGIALAAQQLLRDETGFERLFRAAAIRPLRFFYEDILADPAEAIRWLASELDMTPQANTSPAHPANVRLAGPVSHAWEERLRADFPDELDAITRARPPLTTNFRRRG